MYGSYDHKIDDKGRMAIPSDLRGDLGEVFYVTISKEPCLMAYSSEGWDRFVEKAKAVPMSQQHVARPYFANAARCELDKQGRFLLPQKLRDRANLKKDVAIVGIGTAVQFWDADEFRRVNEEETSAENLESVLELLG